MTGARFSALVMNWNQPKGTGFVRIVDGAEPNHCVETFVHQQSIIAEDRHDGEEGFRALRAGQRIKLSLSLIHI